MKKFALTVDAENAEDLMYAFESAENHSRIEREVIDLMEVDESVEIDTPYATAELTRIA